METDDAIEYMSEVAEAANILSWDVLVFAAIIVGVFGYAYTFGKDYVVPGTFSLYIAAFIMMFIPAIDSAVGLIESTDWIARIIVFAVLYVAVFIIMKTNGFFEPYVVPTGFEIGTFALAFCGLLFVIVGSFFPQDLLETLSPWTNLIFYGELARSIWAVVPIATLLLVRGDA
ncbi:hypothetical protein HON52_01085 [Candidatus Uhrbacteria bacterium]|jgi:hypothetical protein|nr:hypothetical protein [Candidatus Uhrbacteria bacterium]